MLQDWFEKDIFIYDLTGFCAVSVGHRWCDSKLTTAVILHEGERYKHLEPDFKPVGTVLLKI